MALPDSDELHVYGWKYREDLTADENYMDLAALVARNSKCNGGHMGCILVRDGKALCMAINTPLFAPHSSDVHAEINALGRCARRGVSTQDAVAYITMPPCKNCFMALQAAGIGRVVSRVDQANERIAAASQLLGIPHITVRDGPESEARRAALVAENSGAETKAAIEEERRLRKEERKLFKLKKAQERAGSTCAAGNPAMSAPSQGSDAAAVAFPGDADDDKLVAETAALNL